MRILLVDDSQDVSMMLRKLLEQCEHEVACAASGHEALEKAHAFLPEVVCLDLGLPDMSGFELAERLRTQPGLAEAKIIALTGTEADPERLEAAGIDDHMLKPVSLRQILSAISDR